MSRALLLDIGNSSTKWMFLTEHGSVDEGRVESGAIAAKLRDKIQDAVVLVSSVAAPDRQQELSLQLESLACSLWFAQSRGSLDGLANSYADPERMGVDRWLAMLAARHRVEGRLCVVDAGSALTIDLVDANGNHEGGYIIPGTALMERALFADTDRVRDSATASSLAPGRSTAEAVSHGLLLAQAGAVNLAMARATAQGELPHLLLCGGGAIQLGMALELGYTNASRLVFEGLLHQAGLERPELLDYAAIWQVYQDVPA
ncbi:type III pantothenate kinase [Congregibacter sp.]|uniref:type III pantothenate kinase n=1 Tax=Congregibacter sp. TaxID=2744308 RepID=UPI003F6BBDF9